MLYPENSPSGKPPLDAPPPLWRRFPGGPWLLALVLFAVSLALNTRHNDFPYTYHPDERGKVVQLIEKTRNFHHPLLLLTATDWAARLTFTERTPQNLVVVGRWVSAAFAAGSVVALALTAWLLYGGLAGWAAGVVLVFQDELFKTSHYLKEDPALMFGLALSLLAAHLWWRAPGRGTLRFLAIACALAAAGKYLGVLTLVFALPLVWARSTASPAKKRRGRWKAFAAAFALTFLIANVPFPVNRISSPFRSISNEMDGITGGHRGLTRDVPHARYIRALRANTPLPLAVFAGVFVLALAATARRRSPVEWLTFLFPAAYLAMLSFSPKVADRYLLPVEVLLAFLGALGAAEIARALDAPGSRVRQALAALALAAATAWMLSGSVPVFRSLFREYQTDDHAAAAGWVKANLPLDAIIAEDHRVNLSAEKSGGVSTTARVPQTVLNDDFAADLGTLDELRAKGVTHVAICPDTFKRFFDPSVKPGKKERESYDKRKAFYSALFTEGECVVAWPRSEIVYLHPGILIYRLPAKSPPPPQN